MIQIKEEFKKLIPALTTEEFKQLEANCLQEGIREKIITWNGFIIDGHNRYEIATRWSLEYQTEIKKFDNENDVREWMINNQFGRRNLNNYQRSVLALELESVFSARAKEKQQKAGKLKQISAEASVETRKELAKIANVSHDTMARVKVIEAKASEEVKAQLSTEKVSINQVYQDIKKEEKQIEKQIKIDAIKENAHNFKNDDIEIHNIDFRELKINTGTIDLILTDPPYPAEFLHLWKDLFIMAKKVLKPNGFLIAYSGQMYLDKIFQFANEAGLDYYWMINIEFTKKPLVHGRKVLNEWKPILVFQNGLKQHDRVFSDKIKMSYNERELHDLNWGQTVEPFEFLLDRFSNEMDLVFEPFAGTGTTLVACKNKKRRCIGTEIEEKYIDLIKGRL
jgi:16S rRNA G966 N2-methylase RsmD